jgi:DNA mismatch repair ATPase MutS
MDLMQDLDVDTLVRAMAGDDEFLFKVIRKVLFSGMANDVDTILYRQQIAKDCLKNPAIAKSLYLLTVEALEAAKKQWWGMSSHYPDSMLYCSVDLLGMLLNSLKKLRVISEQAAGHFESEAFTALFAILSKELDDEYLGSIGQHLKQLKFPKGVLVSAELGEHNEGRGYVLRQASGKDANWFKRILGKMPPAYTFYIADRDEAGMRTLSDMRHQGISRVATALAQSADHVLSFFKMLRTELAFYVGCLNLSERLVTKNEPFCFPRAAPAGEREHRFCGLYDVCLSLRLQQRAVGSSAQAYGKSLFIVTGANQGGKSCFLRSIGLAQLMMQSGMFVAAESFEAEVCPALLTHFRREEDPAMKSGKLDEELARMSEIIEHIVPNSMLLFNESFAATNEREGSEIANQIVCALLNRRIKVAYVTHLYDFAHGLFNRRMEQAIFFRADREADGRRTFRMQEGEPIGTGYGEDLYRLTFGIDERSAGMPMSGPAPTDEISHVTR